MFKSCIGARKFEGNAPMISQLSLLLVLFLPQIYSLPVVPCGDYTCQHGSSKCVDSPPNFDNHQLVDGSFLHFHDPTSKGGAAYSAEEHCECPARYTGVDCSIPYQECGSQHKCYFGGECFIGLEDVLGMEDLFCDCSTARDLQGGAYVGKFCEHLLTDTNDSILEEAYTTPNVDFSEVQDCSLDCQNGGYCNSGRPDPSKDKMAYDIYRTSAVNSEFQWCDCPKGFFGEVCEVPSAPCGDKICFNNAQCVKWENSTGHAIHKCSCQNSQDSDSSIYYAGKFCEFKATSRCSQPGNFENDHFFCTNGGHCRDDAYLGCLCPSGYHGLSCEYFTGTDSAKEDNKLECNLDCNGRGSCAFGTKDISYLGSAVGAKHLNVSSTQDLLHCVCKDGYTGLHCEHEVDQCGSEALHFCLHGGKCVDNGEGGHSCECSSTTSNLSQAFAGKHCEHPATSFCSKGTNVAAFCVNDGVCIESKNQLNETEDICECLEGWAGPHCEWNMALEEEVDHDMIVLAKIIFIIAALLLTVAVVALYWDKMPQPIRYRYGYVKSTRQVSVLAKWTSNRDHDHSIDTVNLSPTALADEEYKKAFEIPDGDSNMSLPLHTFTDDEADHPSLFMGPPRDEDGNELVNISII